MFIAGNILEGIATILDTVLWLYMWVIIIRALVSWVNPDPWNPIVHYVSADCRGRIFEGFSDSYALRSAEKGGRHENYTVRYST
jgi:hypothetical protein